MPWIFPNFQIFKLFAKLQATCFDLLLCFTFHNQKQIGTFLHAITQPRNHIFQNFIYAKRCVNVEKEYYQSLRKQTRISTGSWVGRTATEPMPFVNSKNEIRCFNASLKRNKNWRLS